MTPDRCAETIMCLEWKLEVLSLLLCKFMIIRLTDKRWSHIYYECIAFLMAIFCFLLVSHNMAVVHSEIEECSLVGDSQPSVVRHSCKVCCVQ